MPILPLLVDENDDDGWTDRVLEVAGILPPAIQPAPSTNQQSASTTTLAERSARKPPPIPVNGGDGQVRMRWVVNLMVFY